MLANPEPAAQGLWVKLRGSNGFRKGRNEKSYREDLEQWMQSKRQVSGGRNKKAEADGEAEGE